MSVRERAVRAIPTEWVSNPSTREGIVDAVLAIAADVDGIAAMLRTHSIRMVAYPDGYVGAVCWGCKWTGDSSGHDTHKAEVVAAHLRGAG